MLECLLCQGTNCWIMNTVLSIFKWGLQSCCCSSCLFYDLLDRFSIHSCCNFGRLAWSTKFLTRRISNIGTSGKSNMLLAVVSPYKMGPLRNLRRREHIRTHSAVSSVSPQHQKVPIASEITVWQWKEARMVNAFLPWTASSATFPILQSKLFCKIVHTLSPLYLKWFSDHSGV